MSALHLVFYMLTLVITFSSIMVITARNPVHSVLFLILTFFNAAGFLILLKAEFLAMLLVIVYVGAVMVLFLFVVMMLDMHARSLSHLFKKYFALGGVIGLILVSELIFLFTSSRLSSAAMEKGILPLDMSHKTNTHALGEVLYTNYFFIFQMAGLILLVAMVGAMVLTLRHRSDVKRQEANVQMNRQRDQSVELVKLRPGEGGCA